MNNKRRGILKQSFSLLDSASGLISMALDEEQDCLDNIPENLQDSEQYQKIEFAIEKLEDTVEQIDSAKESIESAME